VLAGAQHFRFREPAAYNTLAAEEIQLKIFVMWDPRLK
jgi:hypothetical protein